MYVNEEEKLEITGLEVPIFFRLHENKVPSLLQLTYREENNAN